MEALCIQPWEKDGAITEGEQAKSRDPEEVGAEASSPAGSATDEDTDEDEEPEPLPVPRRKVSFADAFGLNLVSVKEFDNADSSESYENPPAGRTASRSPEEFSMSCLFTVPSSPEELDQKLREQMVELESIELLPGTATIRGNIRVVNLCYTKSVYVRMSLDRWETHFDLLTDYVPGSSDLATDRFTFTYTPGPALEAEGTRVELCLRYETQLGTFWANNKEMNYVLFCSKKAPVNGPQVHEEGKSKRSCLRASRRPSAEGKSAEPNNTATALAEAARKAERAREEAEEAELQFLSYQKSLVESVKSRRRDARLARVQDFMSQQRQRVPKARSQEVDRPLPSMWGGPVGLLGNSQKSPRVLTYHEIPLLTLDWNSAKTCTWGSARADDLWDGRADTPGGAPVDSRGGTPSCAPPDVPKVAGKPSDAAASVGDIWQAFLSGPGCGGHSGVSESEWLQTATSVSPSDNPRTPDTRSPQLPGLVSDRQPEGARVSSPGDDRSETKSQTGTWQESGLKGAEHVSRGHKVARERARGGRIAVMGEESCTPPTADVEPSSGGSESTGMPVMLEPETTRINGVKSGTDEACPIRGGSSKGSQIIARTAKSEGSARGNAAPDKVELLKGAGVETDDGPSQGPQTPIGAGDGQQHVGQALQVHRGGCSQVPEEQEEDSHAGKQGRCPASEGTAGVQQAVDSATQRRQPVESRGEQRAEDGGTMGPLPNPSPADVEETRWLLSRDNMVSNEEDMGDNTSLKEIDALRQPETPGRTEDDVKLRASATELKIEERGQLRGNTGVPRGGEENTLTQLEGGELSAEAESSSCAEYEGTKDAADLKAVTEKFGEDLVRAIWEEVFKTPRNDLSADGNVDLLHVATQAAVLRKELRPGVSTPTGPPPRPGLELPLPQEPASVQQICPPEESQTSSDPRAHLCPDSGRPSADSSQSSTTERESHPQVRGEQEVACRGSFSPPPSENSDSLAWWSVFYLLVHVTRLLVFSGFAVGLFFYFFLCDFPAFFALYMFSLCCWFYKWKRREAANAGGMLGWPDPCVTTGEML